jgi:alpha-L-fucosidase
MLVGALKINAQLGNERWKPDWGILEQHEVPEWFLDAKLGIQYVGAPREFNDQEYWHWGRSQQRARHLAADDGYNSIIEQNQKSKILRIDYIWPIEYDDPKIAIDTYIEIGAKYIVSMLGAAVFGTEGLLMTDEEINEARNRGLKVGLHYCFIRWGGQPTIGDPGYINWMIPMLKKAISDSKSDFMFFDGQFFPSNYLRTPDLVAWYYNWADRNGKEVCVNDDLGTEFTENPITNPADVIELECNTMSSVSTKPFIIWDNLRNEWNCWVNEYGINVMVGEVWKWQYKSSDELLHVFIDAVSKGGGWLIQMVNTKKAWETLEPIGKWLKINGEAIYNTRPYFEASPDAESRPLGSEVRANGRFDQRQDWWYKWSLVHKEAVKGGPMYFNQSKDKKTLYVIHWGWPGQNMLVQNVTPSKGSSIYMLGIDNELEWKKIGNDIIVQIPKVKPCEYAYSFKIQLSK